MNRINTYSLVLDSFVALAVLFGVAPVVHASSIVWYHNPQQNFWDASPVMTQICHGSGQDAYCDPPTPASPPQYSPSFPSSFPANTFLSGCGLPIGKICAPDCAENQSGSFSCFNRVVATAQWNNTYSPGSGGGMFPSALATFGASTNKDSYQPSESMTIKLAGVTGAQGSDVGGWITGGIIGGTLHSILCVILGCTTPPYVSVTATLNGANIYSLGGDGVVQDQKTLSAPSTPGTYTLSLKGCDSEVRGWGAVFPTGSFFQSPDYQTANDPTLDPLCITVPLSFTVAAPTPTIDVHF